MNPGDMVRATTRLGASIKTFEKFPGEFNLNRAHWISAGSIGTVLESRTTEGWKVIYVQVLVGDIPLWFDSNNLEAIQ